jgi:hypothetical protein
VETRASLVGASDRVARDRVPCDAGKFAAPARDPVGTVDLSTLQMGQTASTTCLTYAYAYAAPHGAVPCLGKCGEMPAARLRSCTCIGARDPNRSAPIVQRGYYDGSYKYKLLLPLI